jgi:hypothetical protein
VGYVARRRGKGRDIGEGKSTRSLSGTVDTYHSCMKVISKYEKQKHRDYWTITVNLSDNERPNKQRKRLQSEECSSPAAEVMTICAT